MQYLMIASDGKEYGPVDVPTLKQWADESRLTAQTQLKDFATGQVVFAGSVFGIFGPTMPPIAAAPPAGNWQQPPNAYTRPNMQPVNMSRGDDMAIIWGVVLRSIGGLVLFFAFHGIGFIFAGYALYYAIKAQTDGHKNGVLAIVIASVSLVIILLGWVLRVGGAAY